MRREVVDPQCRTGAFTGERRTVGRDGGDVRIAELFRACVAPEQMPRRIELADRRDVRPVVGDVDVATTVDTHTDRAPEPSAAVATRPPLHQELAVGAEFLGPEVPDVGDEYIAEIATPSRR